MDKEILIDKEWLQNFHLISVEMLKTLKNIELTLKHMDKNIADSTKLRQAT
ncbi:MAG: hypothetical protein ACLPT6_06155 [Desulfobaccales bacterium]